MMGSSEPIEREKELKGERKFLQNLMATISDSLLVLDKHLRIKSANRSFYELFQAETEKTIGANIADVLGDKDGELSVKLAALFGTEDTLENYELGYQSKKLGKRILNITARGVIVAEEEEEEEEELVVIQDITERRQSEEALHREKEAFFSILQKAPYGVVLTSQDGRYLYVNPEFTSITGYTLEDTPTGRDWFHKAYPDPKYRQKVIKSWKKDLKLGGSRLFSIVCKDGEIKEIEFKPTLLDDGSVLEMLSDITRRKQAEEALKESEEKFRSITEQSTDGIALADEQGNIIDWNQAEEQITGLKKAEVLGRPLWDVKFQVAPDELKYPALLEDIKTQFLEFLRKGQAPLFDLPYESPLQRLDGTRCIVQEVFFPIKTEKGRMVGVVSRDITERKKMQEQLMIADRLASIGELASGLAHELNNPLTSVIGFAELLLDKDVSDDVKEDVKVIYKEAQRTADVVKNLLTFARKHAPLKQPVALNSIIEKVLELRAYEQTVNNIEVNTHFAPDLPQIKADYFQLQQVFLNIVINAEYFMLEAHNRGTLTIATGRKKGIIRTTLTDDGPGIPKENLGRLFDPFFTTKEVGKGTGLGLSICYGIIAEHDGRIYAESKPGKGATFIVELPITETTDKEGEVK